MTVVGAALGSSTGLGMFETVVIATLGLLAVPMLGGVFAYLYARHRVFTRGLRGTGMVVEVRPTQFLEQHSVVERPTVRVVVATAAMPQGVLTAQKLPVGQYHPGQVVPVVQHPTRPARLYVDRPDLERPAVVVYAPLVVAVMAPVLVVLGLTGQLSG